MHAFLFPEGDSNASTRILFAHRDSVDADGFGVDEAGGALGVSRKEISRLAGECQPVALNQQRVVGAEKFPLKVG